MMMEPAQLHAAMVKIVVYHPPPNSFETQVVSEALDIDLKEPALIDGILM